MIGHALFLIAVTAFASAAGLMSLSRRVAELESTLDEIEAAAYSHMSVSNLAGERE